MESFLVILGSIVISYTLNKILYRFSKNFGVSSRQGQNLIRWASTSKPTTGGIAFFMTFLLASLILFIVKPGLATAQPKYLALFLSATLAFLIGFADDAYGTHPYLKLLGQVFCGVILIIFGIQINFFNQMVPDLIFLDYALTIFWVVGLMNSLNMLDNMDGVTATVALSILVISMAVASVLEGISTFLYIYIAIAGGFIGFLFFNWRPALVYMGDTGSMFIGLLMAFMGIKYFWNIDTQPDNISHTRMLLIPVMVFIVPIMDTTFVTISRISRGISPFQGGRDHLTHHLVHLGVQDKIVPILLGGVSLLSGALAIVAFFLVPEWVPTYAVLFTVYILLLIGIFTVCYILGGKNGKRKLAANIPSIEPSKEPIIINSDPV